MKKIPVIVLFALVASIVVMRAPVTCMGPVAEAMRSALRIDYAAYGVVSSLPVLCFGLFGFVTPLLFSRFPTGKALFSVLVLLSVGLFLRLIESFPSLIVGTLLIGAGIAMLNTVIPVVLRHFFPERVSLALGVFTAATGVSSFAGAALAIPLQQAMDSYAWTLSVWVVFAMPAAFAWFCTKDTCLPSFPSRSTCKERQGTQFAFLPMLSVILTMSLQSLFVYSLIAWLPPLLISRGMTPASAGNALALLLVVAFLSSLVVSFLIRLAGGERRLSVIVCLLCVLAMPFWFADGIWPYVGCLIMAVPHGVRFSLAMILIAKKARNLSQMLLLSSVSQGIGYVVAALGPFVCGFLYKGDGNWWAVGLFLATTVLIWGICAFYGFGNVSVFQQDIKSQNSD